MREGVMDLGLSVDGKDLHAKDDERIHDRVYCYMLYYTGSHNLKTPCLVAVFIRNR